MRRQDSSVEGSESQLNSSTSSYSQIIPRDQIIFPLRKDKQILMRSIPLAKGRQLVSHIQKPKQNHPNASTIIDSSYKNTRQLHQNSNTQRQKEIRQQMRLNQKIIETDSSIKIVNIKKSPKYTNSAYENHQISKQKASISVTCQNEKNSSQTVLKNQQDKSILNFSMSSLVSSKLSQISPQKQFHLQGIKQVISQNQLIIQHNNTPNILEQKIKQNSSQKQLIIKLQNDIDSIAKQNLQLQHQILFLKDTLNKQTQGIELQKKANEIYTQFYHNLSKMISEFNSISKKSKHFFLENDSVEPLNQSMNMQKITQIIEQLIRYYSFQTKKVAQMSSKVIQTQLLPFERIEVLSQNITPYAQRILQLENIIHSLNEKNNQLKKQLLKSTQNNINAIFNSQISASCCLENQVSKIHSEINFIKEKINYLHPSIVSNALRQKAQTNKIYKIYTNPNRNYESSEDYEGYEESKKKKRYQSFRKKNKGQARSQKSISESSLSSKSTKKRQQMSKKEIQKLKEAYSQTKKQLHSLIQTFSIITTSQNQMKQYIHLIKDDIIQNFNQRLRQKQGLKLYNFSPKKQSLSVQTKKNNHQIQHKESDHNKNLEDQKYLSEIQSIHKARREDQKVVQALNAKMIELINAISVPEKVNPEQLVQKVSIFSDDEIPTSQLSVSVEYLRLIQQLRNQSQKQKAQIQNLLEQNQFLKEEIIQLKTFPQKTMVQRDSKNIKNYQNERRESIINELNGLTQTNMTSAPVLNNNLNQHLKYSKTFQVSQLSQPIPSDSKTYDSIAINIKKNQRQRNSHSQSRMNLQNNFRAILQSKDSQIKNLEEEIFSLEETIQYLKAEMSLKQKTIQHLEAYIFSLGNRTLNPISLPSNLNPSIGLHNDPLKFTENVNNNYENYVKNLKILLRQTKKQNQQLRKKLQNFQSQADKRTQSNLALKNSATHSERTTKNFRNSSSYGQINLKHKGQLIIRRKIDHSQRYQMEKEEQKMQSLALDRNF